MTKLPETEQKLELIKPIDQLSIDKSIKLMISEQNKGIDSILPQTNKIKKIIDLSVKHLKKFKKGRIIYCGAGTSGRIGVQDGSELYPTFGWPLKRVDYIIAGGFDALVKSVEGAEDDIFSAFRKVEEIKLSHEDLVFCITASGNTPFTCEVSRLAKNKKALNICISNNKFGKINLLTDHSVTLETGAEVITGSTRLKAGTSQKACLNIISSLIMVKFGYVKNGLMTNLVDSNQKLKDRKLRIQSELLHELRNKK